MGMLNLTLSSAFNKNKAIAFLVLAFILPLTTQSSIAASNKKNQYEAVPGLVDLRSTFSDGTHTIEELVEMAHSRGFKLFFINDHDRIALSYGYPEPKQPKMSLNECLLRQFGRQVASDSGGSRPPA